MNSYHLVHKDGEWKLEAKGAKRATISFSNCTKREAVKQSAEQLRQSNNGASLRIHGIDGRIQEERTYHANSDTRRANNTSNSRRSNAGGPRKTTETRRANASTTKSTRTGSTSRPHTGGPRSSGRKDMGRARH